MIRHVRPGSLGLASLTLALGLAVTGAPSLAQTQPVPPQPMASTAPGTPSLPGTITTPGTTTEPEQKPMPGSMMPGTMTPGNMTPGSPMMPGSDEHPVTTYQGQPIDALSNNPNGSAWLAKFNRQPAESSASDSTMSMPMQMPMSARERAKMKRSMMSHGTMMNAKMRRRNAMKRRHGM